jgi:uncharacterized UBP type Zn finger protein
MKKSFQTKLFSKISQKLVETLNQTLKQKTSISEDEEKILKSIVFSEGKESLQLNFPKYCINFMEKIYEKEIEAQKENYTRTESSSSGSTVKSGSISSYKSTTNPNKQRSPSGYVGLKNQGATCYLNRFEFPFFLKLSLIQALFMTPSFRRSVFQWRYDEEKDKKESKCIPLQLQKLFARLKFSNCESIKTTDLTTSFGWSSRESFQQNDVEELLRVGI